MTTKTKRNLIQVIAAALIAPPVNQQSPRIIPANVLEVRVQHTALVPAQPAAIRPRKIQFQPVHGMAIPGFVPYVIRLLSHTHTDWTLGINTTGYQVDPATIIIEDICERVFLTRFKYQTMRQRIDPVLPIFQHRVYEGTDYSQTLQRIARILPAYAAGKVNRYHMVEAVNSMLLFLGDSPQITKRELTFASWHLVGALDNPKAYV